MDAVLASACIVSFVSLSQSPVFRRQWSSTYEARRDCRLPRSKLLNETPASKAAFQLKQVTRQMSVRPLAIYDRGYGNASFANQTAGIEADLLRVASNRCVYGAPPAYQGRGAPAKHGHKMKLNHPETWSVPSEPVELVG